MTTPDVTAGREAVAAEIRSLLARKRLRHVALAKYLNMSQAALSRRLTGEYPFDIDELQRTATFLGTTVPELVKELPVTTGGGGGGSPFPIQKLFVTSVRNRLLVAA